MSVPPALFVIGSFVAACTVRVERVPAAGESTRASRFLMESGGKGFNVAVAARRLGLSVDGLFAVGTDPLAVLARDAFATNGFGDEMLVTVPGATGGGVGMTDALGDSRIAVCPGANDALRAAHVDAAADRIRAAGMVYAQFESPNEPIARAFRIAREAGVATALNPSPLRDIPDGILASTDMLIVNAVEAVGLARQAGLGSVTLEDCIAPDSPLARWCAGRGIGALVVTLGDRGARIWGSGGWIDQPGFAIEMVDGTGAGDMFSAALIRSVLRGDPWPEALRAACAAGAIIAGSWGTLNAFPDVAALAAFMEDNHAHPAE